MSWVWPSGFDDEDRAVTKALAEIARLEIAIVQSFIDLPHEGGVEYDRCAGGPGDGKGCAPPSAGACSPGMRLVVFPVEQPAHRRRSCPGVEIGRASCRERV